MARMRRVAVVLLATTLAACARKVQETLAICQALSYLAASNSPYLEETAKVCLAACQDCSKECEKHAEKHAECRDCMEACDDVVAKLKKLVA